MTETRVDKTKARLIAPAWGLDCVDELIRYALPALASPGNLPAFTEHFDLELVVVTETSLFERFEASEVIGRIRQHATIEYRSLDDLVVTRFYYGMALTYAFMRGFADLGDRMTETVLLFMNSDFILADGSYRKLAEALLAGERLIVSPSYCVNAEAVAPLLDAKLQDGSIAVPNREMAAIALQNLHYTVRAKVLDQTEFHNAHYDQFYLEAGAQALVGRQMPIAVVGFRPERAITDLKTYWDYGMVSEFCPSIRPHIFGDSDDFLWIELRSRTSHTEYIRIGAFDESTIFDPIKAYVTQDHIDYGRYSLTLHSDDLPPEWASKKQQLAEFVDPKLDALSPVRHMQHPFWIGHSFEYDRALNEWRLHHSASPRPVQPLQPRQESMPVAPKRGVMGVLQAVHTRVYGRFPELRPGHPYHSDARMAMLVGDAYSARRSMKAVLVAENPTVARGMGNFFKERSETWREVDVFFLKYNMAQYVIAPEDRFDVAFIEMDYDELLHLKAVLRNTRPFMNRYGKVIVSFYNTYRRELADNNFAGIRKHLPDDTPMTIHFAGGPATSFAIRIFERAQPLKHDGRRTRRILLRGGFLAIAGLASLVSAGMRRLRRPNAIPHPTTSLTVEISV